MSNIQKAHKIFTNTLIGIVIILASYLLIDVVMKTVLPGGNVAGPSGSLGPWNEVLECTGPNFYDVEKVEQVTLKAKELKLPKVSCVSDLGGTCSVPSTGCGIKTSLGKTDCGEDSQCCLPFFSSEGDYSQECTLSFGSETKEGTCTTFDGCPDDRHSESVAECGGSLICCEGYIASDSDNVKMNPCDAKQQLKDDGIEFWNHRAASCNCGAEINVGTVNALRALNATYGNKIFVTSLTCGNHYSSAHASGIAFDIEGDYGLTAVLKSTWTIIPQAQWCGANGAKVYQWPGRNVRCADEITHLHCEVGDFNQTRDCKCTSRC